MKIYIWFLSIFLLSQLVFAQNQWIVYDSLNSPLINNTVLSLKHDKKNNIWIGTNYGLFKYDGYFWTLYNSANSGLPSDIVDYLVIDTHNNLWFMVSPENYPYFVKFDGINWIKTDTNQTCLQQCTIKKFAVDGNGVKWVSGQQVGGGGGIIRVSGDSCTRYIPDIAYYNANTFFVDQNDNFWISAEWTVGSGVAKYNDAQWLYNHYYVPFGVVVDTLYSEAWFGSTTSLVNIDLNTLVTEASYENGYQFFIQKIYPDKNYNLWCQTFFPNGIGMLGIIEFNRITKAFTLYNKSNSELPSDSVNSIAVDDTNNVWIATENGLAVYNETGLQLLPSISNKDTLDLDTVFVNYTSQTKFIIHNPLSSDLIINSIETNSPVFTVIDTLPAIIPVGFDKEFEVDFSPDTSTIYKNKLTLITNKGMKSIFLRGYSKYPTSVDNIQTNAPVIFSLSQNYPNPFNPTTKIKYQLPELSKVRLTVYDVLGREIKVLVDQEKPAGTYEVEFDAANLPSGVYFYRIEAGKYSDTKKLLLLK